jgi:hypothetical protein
MAETGHPVRKSRGFNSTTTRASRHAADEPFRTSAVSFGPTHYQNGGYPTGSCLVEDLLKEAAPAIARMPDPTKTKNLLRLNRELLDFTRAASGPSRSYANRKAALGLK